MLRETIVEVFYFIHHLFVGFLIVCEADFLELTHLTLKIVKDYAELFEFLIKFFKSMSLAQNLLINLFFDLLSLTHNKLRDTFFLQCQFRIKLSFLVALQSHVGFQLLDGSTEVCVVNLLCEQQVQVWPVDQQRQLAFDPWLLCYRLGESLEIFDACLW